MTQQVADRGQSPSVVAVAPTPVDIDSRTQYLRIFVGRNSQYYLKSWAPLLNGSGGSAGFNWAACLFWPFWLPYRKMYRFSGGVFAVVLIEAFLESLVSDGVFGIESPPVWDGLVWLALALICGFWGNKWYLAHATRMTAGIQKRVRDEDYRRYLLAQRGGTSLATGLLLCVVFCGLLAAVLNGIDAALLAKP